MRAELEKTGTKTAQSEALTFWDHLEVLRHALFRSLGVLLVMMVASFVVLPRIFDGFILGPTRGDFFLYRWLSSIAVSGGPDFSNAAFHVDIININVATQFMMHFSLSFWMGLVLAFPAVLYEIWHFIKPALYADERRNLGPAFVFGGGMFYLGCALGYAVIFPFTFRFLTQYQLSAVVTNQISLNSYLANFLTIIFMMGALFEIPLLAMVLSRLGVVNRDMLRAGRKVAVVVLLVLAAIITPTGDPFTLAVVFIPLWLLYELSILLVRRPQKAD